MNRVIPIVQTPCSNQISQKLRYLCKIYYSNRLIGGLMEAEVNFTLKTEQGNVKSEGQAKANLD